MRPSTLVYATVGVLSTAVGLALFVFPEGVLVGPAADALALVGVFEPTTVGLLVGAFAAVAAAWLARPVRAPPQQRSSADPRFDRLPSAPPEQATARHGAITAAELDDDARRAIERGGEALDELREQLREAAARVYAHDERTAAGAEAAIARGEWTDDPVASAFLADSSPPLRMRLRLWFVPERERRRRIERTVAAIEEVSGS